MMKMCEAFCTSLQSIVLGELSKRLLRFCAIHANKKSELEVSSDRIKVSIALLLGQKIVGNQGQIAIADIVYRFTSPKAIAPAIVP